MDGIADHKIGSFWWAKEIHSDSTSLFISDSTSNIEADCQSKTAIKFAKGAIVDILENIHEL